MLMLCEWYLKEVIVSDSLIFDLKITPDRLLKLIYVCIGCCFCDTLMDKAMGFNSLHMLFGKILQEL